MIRMSRPTRLFLLLSCVLCPTVLAAQEPTTLDRELRVFFDCPDTHCFEDYLTEQVGWVDFVNDRQVADVHVLVSRQSTGGGGSEYTFRFLGRGHFESRDATLRQFTAADATDDDRRQMIARIAQVGLLGYAMETVAAPRLGVSVSEADEDEAAAAPVDDPWDRWVFSTSLNGFFNGESSYRNLNAFGSVGAGRVTETWRHSLRLHGSRNEQEFEIDDSTTITAERESYGTSGLVVRAISDHWSVGAHAGWRRSTRENYDASAVAGPAVEYNFYPFTESADRMLTLLYTVGVRYHDYSEATIFGRSSEPLLSHRLSLGYDATQPWGSLDAGLSASHYLVSLDGESDWAKPQYNLGAGGGAEIRIVRGLSVRFDGFVEMVRDQIELPAGDLPPEEILTQQRELATDFQYWGSFGLTYRFGSIYSTIVNRRLREM